MGNEKGARQAAFEVLNRVFTGAFADILLRDTLESVPVVDRPLATELTYGVLRWQITLDRAIDGFASIKVKKLEMKVLNALRLGAYQLLFLTRIPESAAVNESVKLVKNLGDRRSGFVNAVLRAMSRQGFPLFAGKDPVETLSVRFSHPEWIIRRWLSRYGPEETQKLCAANQEIPPRTLRANTLKVSRPELLKELAGEGIEAGQTRYSPFGIEVLSGELDPEDSRYYIQDEASQIVPLLLMPKPGQRVLDACSAPGGKTAILATLMENSGEVVAVDRSRGRLKSVDALMRRLGIRNVKTIEADVEKPVALEPFDAILLDAPCSGLGVIRRTPEIKLRRSEEEIERLSATQLRLLENVKTLLKKGGRMVYSTCTFEPEETDDVVREFLSRNPDMRAEEARIYLPEACGRLVDGAGFLRTLPQRDNMDGFFAARFYRMAD